MTTPKWEPPPDGDFAAYVERQNPLQQQADARARKAAVMDSSARAVKTAQAPKVAKTETASAGKVASDTQPTTTASANQPQGEPRFMHWSLVLILSFFLIELLDSCLEWTGLVSKSVREDLSGYIFLAAVAWLMTRRHLLSWLKQNS